MDLSITPARDDVAGVDGDTVNEEYEPSVGVDDRREPPTVTTDEDDEDEPTSDDDVDVDDDDDGIDAYHDGRTDRAVSLLFSSLFRMFVSRDRGVGFQWTKREHWFCRPFLDMSICSHPLVLPHALG